MSRVIITTAIITTIAGGDRPDRSTETGSLRRACFFAAVRAAVRRSGFKFKTIESCAR